MNRIGWETFGLTVTVLLACVQVWLFVVFVQTHGRLPYGGGEFINWWLGL